MPASLKARALFGGTVAAGAAVVAVASFEALSAPLATLALLGAAVVVTELLQVQREEQSVDPVDAHTVGFSSGIHLAAVLLVGPLAAALVAAFGVVAVDRLRGTAWRYIVFNASAFAVATLCGGLAYTAAGGHAGTLDLPSAFPAVAGLAVAYSFVNTLLVSGVVALHSRVPVWPYFVESCRHELQAKAAEAGIAVSVAALAVTQPWALVALVPLALAVYQAHARLALLRRETGRALETFANVVDERDSHTYRHSARVAEHVAGLAQTLHLPGSDVARLRWAGRLHDLGKIAVDSAVINKPGALGDDEWAVMRRHPRLSARLLRRFRFAAEEARAVEYHHERFDGEGYYSVEPGSVPIAAHFLIVADSFDAMTSDRPYRRGLSSEEALAEIEQKAGTQFHPAVARAFVAYQRGSDPAQVLTADEQEELRDVFGRARRSRAGQAWPGSAERAVLAGVVLALMAVGFGFAPGAIVAGAVAVAALAERQRSFLRARRLSAFLRAIARPRSRPDLVLEGIAARLAAEGDVRWAGIVRWNHQELAGRIDVSWGAEDAAPGESALMSWLLREAEAEDALLRAPGSELGGSSREAIAVTLRHDRTRTTFLLLAFASRVPRHVELALRALVPELQLALRPGPQATSSEPLAAVAS
jgi:putative nucleotidyltransferase with HDIG domain